MCHGKSKRKPESKSLRAPAERAAEWVLREEYACVLTRRALRAQYAQVDFFAADVMGKDKYGHMIWAQVTTGGTEAVRQRKRKLEAVPWQLTDRVMLLQLVSEPDPAHKLRKRYFFRVHRYCHTLSEKKWMEADRMEINRDWFKAWRGA